MKRFPAPAGSPTCPIRRRRRQSSPFLRASRHFRLRVRCRLRGPRRPWEPPPPPVVAGGGGGGGGGGLTGWIVTPALAGAGVVGGAVTGAVSGALGCAVGLGAAGISAGATGLSVGAAGLTAGAAGLCAGAAGISGAAVGAAAGLSGAAAGAGRAALQLLPGVPGLGIFAGPWTSPLAAGDGTAAAAAALAQQCQLISETDSEAKAAAAGGPGGRQCTAADGVAAGDTEAGGRSLVIPGGTWLVDAVEQGPTLVGCVAAGDSGEGGATQAPVETGPEALSGAPSAALASNTGFAPAEGAAAAEKAEAAEAEGPVAVATSVSTTPPSAAAAPAAAAAVLSAAAPSLSSAHSSLIPAAAAVAAGEEDRREVEERGRGATLILCDDVLLILCDGSDGDCSSCYGGEGGDNSRGNSCGGCGGVSCDYYVRPAAILDPAQCWLEEVAGGGGGNCEGSEGCAQSQLLLRWTGGGPQLVASPSLGAEAQEEAAEEDSVGRGVAWTAAGGDALLDIDSAVAHTLLLATACVRPAGPAATSQ